MSHVSTNVIFDVLVGPLAGVSILTLPLFKKPSPFYRTILVTIVILALLALAIKIDFAIATNEIHPAEWDCMSFWLYGRVASSGLNFYDPLNFAQQHLPIDPDDEFIREILQVGFNYPPQTMLLFLPLGYFDYPEAMALWYALSGMFCLGAVILLSRTYFPENWKPAVLGVTALLLLLRSSITTFSLGQTNFILLFVLALIIRCKDPFWRGFLSAIAASIKPWALVLALVFLVRHKWRGLVGMFSGFILLSVTAMLVFGWKIFESFFHHNPLRMMPGYIYEQGMNQSLLAVLVRTFHLNVENGAPVGVPMFLVAAGTITAFSIWFLFQYAALDFSWAVSFALVSALLLYPSSNEHYSTVLILSVLWLLRQPGREVHGNLLVLLLSVVVLTYMLDGFPEGRLVFFANLLQWGTLMVLHPHENMGKLVTGFRC